MTSTDENNATNPPHGKRSRFHNIRAILTERRQELLDQLQNAKEDTREEGSRGRAGGDYADTSTSNSEGDVAFTILQLKTQTINKIDEALKRLEAGNFGDCFECGDEISERRLRALPFAVRCKSCEDDREEAERRVLLSKGRRK